MAPANKPTSSDTNRGRSTLSRRNILSGLGAAGLTGIAGCTGGSSGDSNSGGGSGDIELDYWMYFGAQEQKEMTTLVEEFNSLDNGITVKKQGVPFSEFLNKLFTASTSGNAPHVASYYSSYGRHLQEICNPIDDYLSNGAKDQYFDLAMKNAQVDGDTYCLPIDIHGKGLYVNDDLLEEAGVDPDFTDWETFKEACNTIESETDANAFSFINWNAGQAAFRNYIIALTQAGGEVLSGEPGSYKVAYDSEIGTQTAQLMADISGEFGWDDPTIASDSEKVKDFVAGDLAMFIAGTWSVNNFENEDGELPEDLNFSFHKPFMFPGDGDNVGWGESNSLYFPYNENHTDEELTAAVEFAEYITQNNTLWASAGGHLPAAEPVATSEEVKSTKLWTEAKTISTMYEMAKDGQIKYQPKTAIHLNSDDYWGPFIDIYTQKVSPEEGLKTSANKLQSALDRS